MPFNIRNVACKNITFICGAPTFHAVLLYMWAILYYYKGGCFPCQYCKPNMIVAISGIVVGTLQMWFARTGDLNPKPLALESSVPLPP